jgi:PAS domain S-box-containing protein
VAIERWLVKQDGSAVRVLIVQGDGLSAAGMEGILDPAPPAEVVRAASVSQARELLRDGDFDVVVADETRLRGVLDALFAFVGLFSLEGVVLDSNQAPLTAGGLERSDVVGRRFVDLPWFSHSEIERARIADAIARAARGESPRLETTILSRAGGIVSIDAAFAPLRGKDGSVTQVVGSGVDVTVRRKAERELARSQQRLAEAQRVAHVGSWEWSIKKDSVTWSDELYRIYGVDRATHVPTYESFLASVHLDDRAHTTAVLAKAMENVTPFVYDHRILRPDGDVRMLHTRGEVLPDPEGRPARLVGSCWDITDRWEAMRRAEASRETLESVLDRVSDGVVALDRQWRYTYVNTCGGRMLGRDAATLVGKHIWTEFPEGRGQKFHLAYERALAEQRPVQIREHDAALDKWFESRIYPSADGLSIFFTDVTEQQRAQDELRAGAAALRALATRLADVREEERRDIARELHDQVGQALTAMTFDVAWLRGQLGGAAKPQVAARLGRMNDALHATLETTRRISASLRPPLLDELGLPAAIQAHAVEFAERTGIRCDVHVPVDGAGHALAPATAVTLFRILQEALTNVARHAGARRVTIALELGDGATTLTVTDDGKGIDAGQVAADSSLGLVGMRERALTIGGTVTISGAPGRGTTVAVTAPRAPAAPAGAQAPHQG